MHSLNPRIWSTLAVFAILAPNPAPAQTASSSFEELRQVLKKGQTVVVTDTSGQRTKGKVEDVSPTSLVVLIPEARTFIEGTVAQIRAPDPLSNGALLGAAIGAGFAMWDYLIDPSEPGNAIIFTVAIGLGTAVGAGIDALQTRRWKISAVVGKNRQGALVSVRF